MNMADYSPTPTTIVLICEMRADNKSCGTDLTEFLSNNQMKSLT